MRVTNCGYFRLYFLTSIFQKTQTQGEKKLKTQGKNSTFWKCYLHWTSDFFRNKNTFFESSNIWVLKLSIVYFPRNKHKEYWLLFLIWIYFPDFCNLAPIKTRLLNENPRKNPKLKRKNSKLKGKTQNSRKKLKTQEKTQEIGSKTFIPMPKWC